MAAEYSLLLQLSYTKYQNSLRMCQSITHVHQKGNVTGGWTCLSSVLSPLGIWSGFEPVVLFSSRSPQMFLHPVHQEKYECTRIAILSLTMVNIKYFKTHKISTIGT